MNPFHPTPEDVEAAQSRRSDFLAHVPAETREAEDRIASVVRESNASSRSKLHRIYKVADALSTARKPFVACSRGCASCCHMNASMTQEEARRLGAIIGRKPVTLTESIEHPLDKYAGVPCPFLDSNRSCSIYADRPLACRTHASFFETSMPCHPSVMNEVVAPIVEFHGLELALARVAKGNVITADIRDFFPPAAAPSSTSARDTRAFG
jgi:uncharacterized protein